MQRNPFPIGRVMAALVIVGTFCSGLLFFVLGVDTFDHIPRASLCVFRNLTGLPCPGCGMTRAILSIGQLRLYDAIAFHPFSPFLLAGLAYYAAVGTLPLKKHHALAGYTALTAIMALWIVRLILGLAR